MSAGARAPSSADPTEIARADSPIVQAWQRASTTWDEDGDLDSRIARILVGGDEEARRAAAESLVASARHAEEHELASKYVRLSRLGGPEVVQYGFEEARDASLRRERRFLAVLLLRSLSDLLWSEQQRTLEQVIEELQVRPPTGSQRLVGDKQTIEGAHASVHGCREAYRGSGRAKPHRIVLRVETAGSGRPMGLTLIVQSDAQDQPYSNCLRRAFRSALFVAEDTGALVDLPVTFVNEALPPSAAPDLAN